MPSAHIARRRYLAALVLCGLVLTPARAEARTHFTVLEDGSIQVEIYAYVWGPGASPELAARWKRAMDEFWNKLAALHSCRPIRFVSYVQYTEAGSDIELPPEDMLGNLVAGLATPEGWDTIYVPDASDADYRANVLPFGYSLLYGWQHDEWDNFVDDNYGWMPNGIDDDVVAHEGGHLLGLADRYTDRIDADGNTVSVPDRGWENTIMADRDVAMGNPKHAEAFDEMIREAEEQLGIDIPACLRFTIELEATQFDMPNRCTVDELDVNLGVSIGADGGYTHGSGTMRWRERRRCEGTYLDHHSTINPVIVMVETELQQAGGRSGYVVRLVSQDETSTRLTSGQTAQVQGTLNGFLAACPLPQLGGTLAEFFYTDRIEDGASYRCTINLDRRSFRAEGSATLWVWMDRH